MSWFDWWVGAATACVVFWLVGDVSLPQAFMQIVAASIVAIMFNTARVGR